MGKRRNRRKKANKRRDPQVSINFSSGDRIQENRKNFSQNEKTNEEDADKAGRNTPESGAASMLECETLHRVENVDESKDPVKSCIRPDENRQDSYTEEPQCMGIYDDKFKNSNGKSLVTPEWKRKVSPYVHLAGCTSGDGRNSHKTSGNEVVRKSGQVKCETLRHGGSADGSKNPSASCIRPDGLKSKSKSPWKNFEDSAMEERKVVDLYENRFKTNYDRSLVSPKQGKNFNRNHPGSACVLGPSRDPKKCFEEVLNRWLPVRNKSIRKLQQLQAKAAENEKAYDNIDLNLKYGSQFCKLGKVAASPSSPWESLCSVGSIVLDLAGGLSSISHVVSTDNLLKGFQEIIDEDANATKKMYEGRSRYVTEYQYTEEIIRKFGGTTLGETLGKISEAVGVTEFFRRMEKAKDNNENIWTAAITALDDVMTRNSCREVGLEVDDAIRELVDTNPACVEAVGGVKKSLYGAANLCIKSRASNHVWCSSNCWKPGFGHVAVNQNYSDICNLERKIQSGSETTIGKRIREALHIFEQEKNEMPGLLHKLQRSISLAE